MKVVLLTAASVVLVAALAVGLWFGYWALRTASISNTYNSDTHNQQYQAGIIAQERDNATGYQNATDPGQKKQIASTFCSLYQNLDNPIPNDLVQDDAQICH